ncbi:unnamed protein product [Brassica rapa subsp. narinosa]
MEEDIRNQKKNQKNKFKAGVDRAGLSHLFKCMSRRSTTAASINQKTSAKPNLVNALDIKQEQNTVCVGTLRAEGMAITLIILAY